MTNHTVYDCDDCRDCYFFRSLENQQGEKSGYYCRSTMKQLTRFDIKHGCELAHKFKRNE